MNIKVHIGRLTVEGVSHADGLRVGEALRSRLAELAAVSLLRRASNIDRLDAGEIPRGASAEQTGRHVAGRIFQNLKGSPNG
jgi:hypothetical protein